MRAAEVFLRLGSGLVAWMLIYAYALWLAVLNEAGCVDGDQLHRVLLAAAVLAAAVSPLLTVTRPFGDVHRLLRWLAVPLALLLPFALRNVWAAFDRVHMDGLALCDVAAPTPWQSAWAPAQLFIVILLVLMILRAWRTPE